MKKELEISIQQLLKQVNSLIQTAQQQVVVSVNSQQLMLYWHIGQHINHYILQHNRADYGQQIVVTLSRQLQESQGNSFNEKNLRRMMQFSQAFPDEQIVVTASRQLSWSHFVALIPLKENLQREFYLEICKLENWSVRTLRDRIESMLFERTAISKKPDELIQKELQQLRNENKISPELVFRDTYILDFLGLKNVYSEKNLEDAIIRELETFILEVGKGFAFVERQKKMIIDGEDFSLDLLFYHRTLKRLVAIELKLGKFKAEYKSKMELYLRWLEKYEMQTGEETPIGLLLCAEGNHEQVELLQLDKAGIKLAEYLTELPSKELLQQKLHQAIIIAKHRLENKKMEEE